MEFYRTSISGATFMICNIISRILVIVVRQRMHGHIVTPCLTQDISFHWRRKLQKKSNLGDTPTLSQKQVRKTSDARYLSIVEELLACRHKWLAVSRCLHFFHTELLENAFINGTKYRCFSICCSFICASRFSSSSVKWIQRAILQNYIWCRWGARGTLV